MTPQSILWFILSHHIALHHLCIKHEGHFLKSTIGALFPLPIISICHFILGLFFLAPYSPVPIFQATMESMTMKGFSMLLQTVFWGCFINSIHNMSYYMEVSSCPTLPLSWVSNCPVSKCPVSSCPVSSCPGFIINVSTGKKIRIPLSREATPEEVHIDNIQ